MHSADRIRSTVTVGLPAMTLLSACSSGPPPGDGSGHFGSCQTWGRRRIHLRHDAGAAEDRALLRRGRTPPDGIVITADRSRFRRSRVRPPHDRSRGVPRLAAVQALAGVDVSFARGAFPAMSWLSRHGSDYGLCQTDANEEWHYELSVEPGAVCPSPRDSAVSA